MRTLIAVVLGSLVAAAVMVGAYHGYQRVYRLPAGPDFYTFSNLAAYALAAPR